MTFGEDTERVNADSVRALAGDEPLEVGGLYEAIGPAHGSKLGPPARVKIVEELEHGWRTEAPRQPATIIRREAARNWRRITA